MIKKSLSQIRDFLRTPGSVEMVIALVLTALDALIFRESNSDLLLPTIIGGLQVILVAVATYLPLFAMVVVPANFLALTFLPTEQAPAQPEVTEQQSAEDAASTEQATEAPAEETQAPSASAKNLPRNQHGVPLPGSARRK